MGYIKADSLVSLLSAGGVGLVLIMINAIFPQRKASFYVTTVLAVILCIFFVIRMIKTGKAMPAAPVLLFSGIAIILNVYKLNKLACSSQ